ncbi:MAG: hypothetical protein AAF495_20135 [Pseudomonadota bacterium]
MPQWPALSTIATSLIALAAAPLAAASDPIDRLLTGLAASGWLAEQLIAGDMRQACGADILCAAGLGVAPDGPPPPESPS